MDIQRVSAYYCPSKILWVDDERDYIKLLVHGLNIEFPIYDFFDKPAEAFKYFTESYKPNDFLRSLLVQAESDGVNTKRMDVDIQAIHTMIYNPNRFSEISLLVTDLNMPSHTGAELCESLRNKRSLKKLLFTSQSEEKLAIDLLNKRIIDQFIRKAASTSELQNFVNKLEKMIQELRQDYFYQLSQVIISTVLLEDGTQTAPFDRPEFIHLFNQIINENKLCEYYLIDASGSFLFLSPKGEASYLLMRSEDDIRTAVDLLKYADFSCPEDVLQSILQGEKILYWDIEEGFPNSFDEVLTKLYPAKRMGAYCYSYVKDRNLLNIVQNKIVSFEKFCESQINTLN